MSALGRAGRWFLGLDLLGVTIDEDGSASDERGRLAARTRHPTARPTATARTPYRGVERRRAAATSCPWCGNDLEHRGPWWLP
jgi:hypothetical protein